MENKDFIKVVNFSNLNLEDPFFDSLKDDYSGFSEWFKRKANNGAQAFVLFNENKLLRAFLYLKTEDERDIDQDIKPGLPAGKKLKVGTFKIEPHRSSLGQRFMTIILRKMIRTKANSCYVTMLANKQRNLAQLFLKFGFIKWGVKKNETVYVKRLDVKGDIYLDFPRFTTNGNKKIIFGIRPKYHTKLFPDSRLANESGFARTDITHSNSIEKIYLCNYLDVPKLKNGDLLIIYRTKGPKGPAKYTSVATSICTFVEMRTIFSFRNLEEFKKYVKGDSVFTEDELNDFFNNKRFTYVVKMIYNLPLTKKVILNDLRSKVGISDCYWGFHQVNDDQFKKILELGKANESFIIN